MKKIILIIFSIFIFSSLIIQAQEKQDVIYLNNGDIIKGEIIENVPNDYIRIELLGGSILTYKYLDIKKFTREKIEKFIEEKETPPQTNVFMQQQQQQQQQVVSPQQTPVINSGLSDAQKMALYESQKKSPATARVLSFLISSAGHAYAGNWGRGLLYLLGRGLFITAAASTQNSGEQSVYLGLFIGCSIAEIVDAGSETEKYNARLYNSIMNGIPNFGMNFEPMNKICNLPINDGVQLNLRYDF